MKQLHEFNTLQEAQAFQLKGQRMISPDMLVNILTKLGAFTKLTTEGTEASVALNAALQFGSEFNFIEGHPSSITSLLSEFRYMDDTIKQTLIGYANPVSYPYKETTQEEFNEALRIQSHQGTTVGNVIYNSIEPQEHFVNQGFRSIIFVPTFESLPEAGSTIEIKLAIQTKSGWTEDPKVFRIPVVAGEQPQLLRVPNNYTRRVKVSKVSVGLKDSRFLIDMIGE